MTVNTPQHKLSHQHKISCCSSTGMNKNKQHWIIFLWLLFFRLASQIQDKADAKRTDQDEADAKRTDVNKWWASLYYSAQSSIHWSRLQHTHEHPKITVIIDRDIKTNGEIQDEAYARSDQIIFIKTSGSE